MAGEVFATTHWSVVLTAREAGGGEANRALETLCRTYWPPLYAWLRRQGHAPADAEDLVQGFFEGFLGRNSLNEIGQEKGRFRSFLLASLRHHLLTTRRNERTQKRGGGLVPLSLEDPAVVERCEAALMGEPAPETVFDRVWAETILERALRGVREEYENRGRTALFDGVKEWLVREAKPGEYEAAAPGLGISEGALSVAVHRLRTRFRSRVRTEVSQTVATPGEVDDEVRYLSRILTKA